MAIGTRGSMMADLWHPQAEQVRAPTSSWGTYRSGPYRGVLHTTETDNYPKSTSSYFGNNFWPHATIGLVGGSWHIWQHIPINRAARALQHPAGTVETNNQSAVQCEIVWRASKAREIPAALMDGIRAWMRWVEATVGVTRRATTFYGQDAGFTLASSSARQRMTAASWKAFDGWCGHQHVPANSHWDPGAIDIAALLSGGAPAQPDEEDDMTSEEHNKLVHVEEQVDKLRAQVDHFQDIFNTWEPWLQEIKDKVAAAGGGAGVDLDALAEKVTDKLAARLAD